MNRTFIVPTPNVVSEIIDGELIVLDLVAGRYHATDGVGAVIWRLVTDGVDEASAIAALTEQWPSEPVAESVRAFLDTLVEGGLLIPATYSEGAPQSVSLAETPWSVPQLNSYDDLADMIQLDPIHDVADSGWPTANPTRT